MGGVGSEEGAVAWLRRTVSEQSAWQPPSEERLQSALTSGEMSVNEVRWVRYAAKLLESGRAALLKVIDLCEDQMDRDPRENDGYSEGRDDDEIKRDEALADFAGDVLSLLAQGYRHRDGYAEHWPGQA
jgi:hypothetical protein